MEMGFERLPGVCRIRRVYLMESSTTFISPIIPPSSNNKKLNSLQRESEITHIAILVLVAEPIQLAASWRRWFVRYIYIHSAHDELVGKRQLAAVITRRIKWSQDKEIGSTGRKVFFLAIYIYYLYVHIYIYPLISLSSATVGCFLKQPAKTLWIDSNARALLLYTDYIYMHINTYINPFLLPSLMYITLYLPYTTSLAQSR